MSNSAFKGIPLRLTRPPRRPRSSDAAWFLAPALVLVAAVGACFMVGMIDELPISSLAPASAASMPAGG